MRIVCITIFLAAFTAVRSGEAFPTSGLEANSSYAQSASSFAQSADTTDYVITETDWSPRTYVGKRDTVSFDDITHFFTEHLRPIYGAVQSKGVTVGGPASGLYWHWDMENMRTVMAAVVPVEGSPPVFEDYEVIQIPAGKALVTDHFGPYEQMMGAHEAIDAHIAQHKMGARTVVLEEYMTDPEAEPDSSKWQTRITYIFAE